MRQEYQPLLFRDSARLQYGTWRNLLALHVNILSTLVRHSLRNPTKTS